MTCEMERIPICEIICRYTESLNIIPSFSWHSISLRVNLSINFQVLILGPEINFLAALCFIFVCLFTDVGISGGSIEPIYIYIFFCLIFFSKNERISSRREEMEDWLLHSTAVLGRNPRLSLFPAVSLHSAQYFALCSLSINVKLLTNLQESPLVSNLCFYLIF